MRRYTIRNEDILIYCIRDGFVDGLRGCWRDGVGSEEEVEGREKKWRVEDVYG